MVRDGRHFENLWNLKLRRAVLSVLFEDLVQDLAGLWSVTVEKGPFLFPEPLRALAATAQGRVEGDMTEKEVLSRGVQKEVRRQPPRLAP